MKCYSNPYEGKQNYIFFCYCHADAPLVFPIIERLSIEGFRVWYDDGLHPGDVWPEITAKHLAGAKVCMAAISKNSAESHNCRNEVSFAIANNKPFLSILIEDFPMPLGMQLQMSSCNYIRREEHDSETFYQKLISAPVLAECRNPGDSAAPFALREWERHVQEYRQKPVQAPERSRGFVIDPAWFEERQRLEAEIAALKKEQEEAQARLREEKARLQAEAEKHRAEEERLRRERLRIEEERKKAEQERPGREVNVRLSPEEEARLREERVRQAREAEEKRLAEEEARQKAERERLARENEEKRLEEEKRQAEEEARQKAEQERLAREAEAKRKAEEEARQKAEQERLARENEAKWRAEAEARQRAERERLIREAEAKWKKAEEERLAREAEEKRLAEEEARKKAEEERLAREAEAKRRAAEEEARKKAEEERLAREAEEKRLAEEEARKKAEEERLAREAEAKRIAALLNGGDTLSQTVGEEKNKVDPEKEERSEAGENAESGGILIRLQTGEIFRINGDSARIGRAADSDIVFSGNRAVSHTHFTILKGEGSFSLQNNSSSAMEVNGQALQPGESIELADCTDITTVGEQCFFVCGSAYRRIFEEKCLRMLRCKKTGETRLFVQDILPLNRFNKWKNNILGDKRISREHHAELFRKGTLTMVRDEGSLHGTFLNGRRLDPGEEAELHNGDSLAIVETEFIYYEATIG